MPKVSIIDIDKLKVLINKGLSAKDIGTYFGCSRYNVQTFSYRNLSKFYTKKLLKSGKKTQGGKPVLLNIKSIKRLASKGKSINEIVNIIKVSSPTITKRVKELDINLYHKLINNGLINKSASNQVLTSSDLKKMVKLSKEGKGIDTIGRILECDGTTVRYNLIKAIGKRKYKSLHSTKLWKNPKFTVNSSSSQRGKGVQSYYEKVVADWLYNNNFDYQLHSKLPLGKKIYYPDFYIFGINKYIEVFGMFNVYKGYNERVKKKKWYYSYYNIPCIYLYPRDYTNFDHILEEELCT